MKAYNSTTTYSEEKEMSDTRVFICWLHVFVVVSAGRCQWVLRCTYVDNK